MNFSTSVGQFSDFLTELIIKPTHTGNALVSPLSLLTAVSMLLVGSRGPTREKAASALKLPSNFSQEEVDSYYNTLISAYKSQATDRNKLLIMNKMLVSVKDQPFLPSFEETVRGKYDASVDSVDFINRGVEIENQVNSWVNECTNGLVKGIMNEPPRNDTVLMLLNAVYFESKWMNKLMGSYRTKFYVDGSIAKNATFISRTGWLKYSELDGPDGVKVQALVSPYESGHSMVILLPPKNTSVNSLFVQKKISSMARQVVSEGRDREINLHMPKLKFDTKVSMKSLVSLNKLDDLFARPEFSGMNGASDLKISSVEHATANEVDEEGTKAEAATLIENFNGPAVIQKEIPLQVVLDRPFAFVIYEAVRNLPIFVGKLGKPPSLSARKSFKFPEYRFIIPVSGQ